MALVGVELETSDAQHGYISAINFSPEVNARFYRLRKI